MGEGVDRLLTVSILTLAFTGFVILMAHPRLYWGETGNALTPALIELPISRNHRHGGWVERTPIEGSPGGDQRQPHLRDLQPERLVAQPALSLAWFVVVPGAIYLIGGLVSGHFRRHLWPRLRESPPRAPVGRARQPPSFENSPRDGRARRWPAAEVHVLRGDLRRAAAGRRDRPGDVTNGRRRVSVSSEHTRRIESARTIHFFTFIALMLFAIAHVVMVIASGFRRQMRGMTLGR